MLAAGINQTSQEAEVAFLRHGAVVEKRRRMFLIMVRFFFAHTRTRTRTRT